MSDESSDEGARLKRKPARRTSAPRSEFDFINSLRRRQEKRLGASKLRPSPTARRASGRRQPSPFDALQSALVCGIGDDAAVVRARAGRDLLMTADLLIEDIDFRLASAPPRLLGHKALAVSLSDIAAMGGRPLWAMLSVGLTRSVWESSFLEEFYEGFHALAAEHGLTLIGGDTSRTRGPLVFDSIVVGEATRGRAVLRSGARAGDRIFVTGRLGGAAAGLRLLEEGARLRTEGRRARRGLSERDKAREGLLLRHLRPTPRVEWGQTLGRERLATAMIDLSDGLSSDLAHLCRESGVGAFVDASLLPCDPLIEGAQEKSFDALALALHGGEDYELLFTARPRKAARLPRRLGGVALTEIGEVVAASEGIKLLRNGRAEPLRPSGYEHFK